MSVPPAPPPPAYEPSTQQTRGWSVLAILGFVFAFLIPLVGLILSIIGINMTGEGKQKGRGLAVAGLVISILNSILGILLLT